MLGQRRAGRLSRGRQASGLLVPIIMLPVIFLTGSQSVAHRNDPADCGQRRTSVAVVDTGIKPIPQLGDSVDWRTSDSVVPDTAPTVDQKGHGTQMATIIHAHDPGARLMAVKALGVDGGSEANLAAAIRYATENGAEVINLSVEGGGDDEGVRGALEDAQARGVIVVVAAGNRGLDLDRHPAYPASYGLSNLVVVSATDHDGRPLAISNRGRSTVDAPGDRIPAYGTDGRATTVTGTSPAAAIVTADIARRLACSPADEVLASRAAVVRTGLAA
jgi:hypothetical protein